VRPFDFSDDFDLPLSLVYSSNRPSGAAFLPRIARPFHMALVLAALALPLTGCGRRGPLEPPPGSPASLAPLTGVPDQYAAPRSVADLPGENAAGVVVAPVPDQTPPQPKANNAPAHAPRQPRPFLLDPLL
jgi:predicted small lipoprotein YifL